MEYTFKDMLNDLKNGREIEFDYKEQHYSIVNGNGKWCYCADKQSTELCNFEEKKRLIGKVKKLIVQNETMENVINKKLYAKGTLYVL
ncbi:MAG: hypothetical protein PHU31_05410 [Anaerotignum sp.]|nr:hypothetical protein [Anaerotignum sp.]